MRIRRSVERWFPMIDDPDDAEVLIKHLTPGEVQDVSNKSMPQKYEYEPDKDGNLRPKLTVGVDSQISRELTFRACVKDWKNFFDEDDAPLPYSPDNVVRALREIEGFIEFIEQCRNTLAESIKEEQRGQEKN